MNDYDEDNDDKSVNFYDCIASLIHNGNLNLSNDDCQDN